METKSDIEMATSESVPEPTTTETTKSTSTTTTTTAAVVAAPPAKVKKVIKSKPAPKTAAKSRKELDEEKLNDIEWTDLTPIGFEFNTWPSMKQNGWSFPDIKKELTSGVLSNIDHPLYMFLGAQPIVENNVAFNMPYIVVFDSPSAPPSKLCKTSIQSGSEEVYNFSDFHYAWAPYQPSRQSNNARSKNYKIYQLNSNERPGKVISEEKAKTIEYLLPYILIPKIFETFKVVPVTNVTFILKDAKLSKAKGEQLVAEREAELKAYKDYKEQPKAKAVSKKKAEKNEEQKEVVAPPPKPSKEPNYKVQENGDITKDIEVYFDKQSDSIDSYPEEFVDDEGLDESMAEIVEARIREEFKKARATLDEKYNEMKKEVESYTPEKKEDYNNAKIYKFYPHHKKYNVQKYVAPTINRFFGNATKTFPEAISKDLTSMQIMDEDEVKKIAEQDKAAALARREERLKREAEGGSKGDDESNEDSGSDESDEESEDEQVAKPTAKEVSKKKPAAPSKKVPAKPSATKGKKAAANKGRKPAAKVEQVEEEEEDEEKEEVEEEVVEKPKTGKRGKKAAAEKKEAKPVAPKSNKRKEVEKTEEEGDAAEEEVEEPTKKVTKKQKKN